MVKIDWFFEHKSEHFVGRLEKLVVEIHRLATEQLSAVYAAESEDAAKDLGDNDLPSYEKFLEGEHRDQRRALSTMALTMLASLLESFLDEARTRLDTVAFPTAKKYPGKSELLRRVNEFKARFQIDLKRLPGFDMVQEVVLARNSSVHRNAHPSKDYLRKTKRRFLEELDMFQILTPKLKDEDRFICCDVKTLKQAVEEVSKFAVALHAALNSARTRELSDNQPN
jgi:hypothetical protein